MNVFMLGVSAVSAVAAYFAFKKPAFRVTALRGWPAVGAVACFIVAVAIPQFLPPLRMPYASAGAAAVVAVQPVQAPAAPDAAQSRREALERCEVRVLLQVDAACSAMLAADRQEQARVARERQEAAMLHLCEAFTAEPGKPHPVVECRP